MFLKEGENEIIIGTGCREQLPDAILNGRDNEKLIYIPGSYDNVELTFSNRPFIDNIRCVPDIVNGALRVVAEIEADACAGWELAYVISVCPPLLRAGRIDDRPLGKIMRALCDGHSAGFRHQRPARAF
ncbi:MAG: hypothetical protein LBG47_04940 [Prevotellaceae bacterium]|nr:hypothetical protein [Prevotellaceae bacterium]